MVVGIPLLVVGFMLLFFDLYPYNLPVVFIGGFLAGFGVVDK